MTTLIERLRNATGPLTKHQAQEIADLLPASAGLDYALLVMALQGGYDAVGAALALVERMLPHMLISISRSGTLNWSCCIQNADEYGDRIGEVFRSGNNAKLAIAILISLFTALTAKEA